MGTQLILFRDPQWRATRPCSTYREKWEELNASNAFDRVRWEISMNACEDGYIPHAFNIPTDLEVIPQPIGRDCTLLVETLAAIEAKGKDSEDNMDEGDDTESVEPSFNDAEDNESTVPSDNTGGDTNSNKSSTTYNDDTKSTTSSITFAEETQSTASWSTINSSTSSSRPLSSSPNPPLFDYTSVHHHLTYHRLAEAGFSSYWQIPPMGTALWVTIEGDTPSSSRNNTPEDDATAATVLCSVVQLTKIPKENNKAFDTLHDFLQQGTEWEPNPEYIQKITLVRGDTLLLPPFTIFRFFYVKNTMSTCGLVLRKEDLRSSIIAWRWACLGMTVRQFEEGQEILDYLRDVAKGDPMSTGFTDELSLVELDQDYNLISDSLLEDGNIYGYRTARSRSRD